MESENVLFNGFIVSNFMRPSWAVLVLLFTLITCLSFQLPTRKVFPTWVMSSSPSESDIVPSDPKSCSGYFQGVRERKVIMSIKDFGGVGDGKTSNTESFRRAVRYMQRFGEQGGSQLNIPRGRWLTGSFNLTSNFTLFIEEGAVILGSQVCRINSICSLLFFFLFFEFRF